MSFWKMHLPWTKKFVQDNIHIVEESYKLFPARNNWNCNVHAVYEDDTDVPKIDYGFLRKKYMDVSAEFAKSQRLKHIFFGEVWYNYYKKSQYQEPHIHESTWTAVHYLKFNRFKHPRTKFTDPNIKPPRVREGDLIVFPGTYEHYVEKCRWNEPRLTIAFGISATFLHNDQWLFKNEITRQYELAI